ncbi:dUTP diphosphatase [Yersinia ruckeri]|uniref:dUTP diphosphatase n=1 Tax=Yersinia ruckeri TaxID=29486 RepID=UPI0022374A97|nr:hypothetical protein [Yersinia ruckeri]MCW6598797.1 hypothetical protein [Yersinia ruckeri]
MTFHSRVQPTGLVRCDGHLPENEQVPVPAYGTEYASCFDLSASVKGRDLASFIGNRYQVELNEDKEVVALTIFEGGHVLIPTGFIFDMPEGFGIDVLPRSGLALKHGLVLRNCTGVIDNDFPKETLVMLENRGNNGAHTIKHGERVAQARLVPVYVAEFKLQDEWTPRASKRTDGFGHTGV